MSGAIKNQLITFATSIEAKATILALSAVQESDNLYRYPEGLILITGMGSLHACSTVSKYAATCERIWNFGIAGTLVDRYGVGTLLSIGNVGKHLGMPQDIDTHSQQFANKVHPPFQREGEARLVTTDFPIHHHALRSELSCQYDLVDMEGYGICCAAQLHHKPVILYKMVSDFAKLGGQHLIRAKIEEYSEQLAKHVVALVV